MHLALGDPKVGPDLLHGPRGYPVQPFLDGAQSRQQVGPVSRKAAKYLFCLFPVQSPSQQGMGLIIQMFRWGCSAEPTHRFPRGHTPPTPPPSPVVARNRLCETGFSHRSALENARRKSVVGPLPAFPNVERLADHVYPLSCFPQALGADVVARGQAVDVRRLGVEVVEDPSYKL